MTIKIITNIAEANRELENYSGAKLNIALYSVSLKRLAIRLVSPTIKEEVYIVGIGCEKIKGYFSYKNANIKIKAKKNIAGV